MTSHHYICLPLIMNNVWYYVTVSQQGLLPITPMFGDVIKLSHTAEHLPVYYMHLKLETLSFVFGVTKCNIA